jgi:hypothetical protein
MVEQAAPGDIGTAMGHALGNSLSPRATDEGQMTDDTSAIFHRPSFVQNKRIAHTYVTNLRYNSAIGKGASECQIHS